MTKATLQYANEAASKAYGYSLDEFLNMNIRSLLHSRMHPQLIHFLRHIVEKGETSLEMIHLRKNKSPMHVKLYSNMVKTLHGQFIVVVIRESYVLIIMPN